MIVRSLASSAKLAGRRNVRFAIIGYYRDLFRTGTCLISF